MLWSLSGKATVLQDAGGAGFDFPEAINDAGWSVGVSYTAGGAGPNDPDAVLWSPSGKATVLQDVGGHDYSWALAINSSGWSVGYSNTRSLQIGAPTDTDAVLWSPSGKATVLHDVGGRRRSDAFAINASGQSVGISCTSHSCVGMDAVLWSPTGKATVLQDAGGQGFSQPAAINSSGWSVGSSLTGSDGRSEAVLWSPTGKATVLQDAGGQGYSSAGAVNDAGWSVGSSDTLGRGYAEAVLWSPSGKATVLQEPGGVLTSFANAINASGWSVGISLFPGSVSEAMLWSPSGKAWNLGAMLGPAWSDTEALGLNNSGDIIGVGDVHGKSQGFLLTRVSAYALSATAAPEPSTWAMMFARFAGLGLAGYRRGRKSDGRSEDSRFSWTLPARATRPREEGRRRGGARRPLKPSGKPASPASRGRLKAGAPTTSRSRRRSDRRFPLRRAARRR